MIIFASKFVGFKCLKYLEEADEAISVVVVPTASELSIIDICETNGIHWFVYDETTVLKSVKSYCDSADWLLNLWSPFILKPEVLKLAEKRLNVHPSLVPACRGNDTAAWSIRLSLQAGVSLIEMDNGIDTGGIYCQEEVLVEPNDTGKLLYEKQVNASIQLFKNSWPRIKNGKILPLPQNSTGTHFTRAMTNEDRLKEWSSFSNQEAFDNWVRAHDFFQIRLPKFSSIMAAYTGLSLVLLMNDCRLEARSYSKEGLLAIGDQVHSVATVQNINAKFK